MDILLLFGGNFFAKSVGESLKIGQHLATIEAKI